MDDNFFQQFIPGPTHIAGNKLDLLLCNCPEIIEDVLTSYPREKRFLSDLYVVKIKIQHKFKHTRDSLAKVPFNLAGSTDINEHWTNCLYGQTDLNVHNFVSFVTHGRTRQSNSFNLKIPFCNTATFQASYFNRMVKLWNLTSNCA